MSYNRTILMGNLTRDPELREVGSSSVCNFSIACNRRWKDKDGEMKEEVSYFDCAAWGPRGEIISKHFTKGKPILIEGELRQERWEQDGNKRSKVVVNVDDFTFVGSRNEQPVGAGAGASDDDIPF